jgi:phage terminase large subunit-like protein
MAKRPVPRFPAGVTAAIAYCHAVLDGTVVACQIVHRACSRFVEELDAAEAGQGPWAFRPDLAERAMIFAGLMRNIRGPEAGQLLRLMAWQQFVFANLFGFVERGTDTRRFR